MTKALEGVSGQHHAPAALYPGKDPVPIVHVAGWAPGTVWRVAENLAPTWIRSSDSPARSQSLYRLRYLAHQFKIWDVNVLETVRLLEIWVQRRML
jgi:hypothetical protein